ncbi:MULTISPECIES: hypothetical protein [Sinorhizobium]|uniref:hypothetical protein n=1 Tax=Sinorhizobium TaxID=28105 RepID=UPI000BE897B2|nr:MULTISPECIES: hypothetical protein [Sinorhizobium]PDT55036.1 hypothetical protein CO664_08165 [Sinorhizobium sp. NG07B]POH32078.1 hypothetical protein ATY30_11800 [Sinorhizobium americanum]
MAENQFFAAQVSEWAMQEKARQEAVLREAAQMVANNVRTSVAAGGRMPVDTGNLKNSLMASTSAMPMVDQDEKAYPDSSGEIELIISNLEVGGTLYLGFQAAYGPRMNYGFVGEDSLGRLYNQAGYGFVDAEAQDWPQTVKRAEEKVRGRFERG